MPARKSFDKATEEYTVENFSASTIYGTHIECKDKKGARTISCVRRGPAVLLRIYNLQRRLARLVHLHQLGRLFGLHDDLGGGGFISYEDVSTDRYLYLGALWRYLL